jgi:hypothetical protein
VVTKWYVPEANTAASLRLRGKFSPPLVLTHLHRLELETAWQLKVFRKEMSADVAARAAADLQSDVEAGVWLRPEYDLTAVFVTAERLSREYAASLGTRTLDVWHVAAAHQLGCEDFVTGDDRQAKLAACAGMKVTRL